MKRRTVRSGWWNNERCAHSRVSKIASLRATTVRVLATAVYVRLGAYAYNIDKRLSIFKTNLMQKQDYIALAKEGQIAGFKTRRKATLRTNILEFLVESKPKPNFHTKPLSHKEEN